MSIRFTAWSAALAAAAAAVLPSMPAHAEYAKPPAELLKVLTAPPPPMPSVDPTGRRLLLTTSQTYPSISRVAQPYLKLAGSRIEIANHSKHDTPGGYGITPCARSFELAALPGGATTPGVGCGLD